MVATATGEKLLIGRRPVRNWTQLYWQSSVAPPGSCNRVEVRYGSIGGLEYEVPQSRLYCLCINVALCSTALQCICRVMRISSMTMKAHTYCIIFGRPPIGGKLPPPWRRHWQSLIQMVTPYDIKLVFVQKITFFLRKIKINKNCCHQSCTI